MDAQVRQGTVEMAGKRLGWLRNAALAVFVAAVLAGLFLPLYTDEIGWRWQERAGFDGVDKLLGEQCGPNTIARPPFWMMPVRHYSALFNGLFAEPLYVRISGILYALVWTAMMLRLIRQVTAGARERIALSTLALGFLSFGTMPLMLIWSRPEQPIMLAFTGAMLIASSDWTKAAIDTPAKTAWLRSLTILALALVAMSYHLKAIFTIPLFLVCLAFASRGPKANVPRFLVGLIVFAATLWAAHYWIDRLQCPNDPMVRENFARNNTGAALLNATEWSQISPLIGKAFDNLSLFQYLGMPAPRNKAMSDWLPPGLISYEHSFLWFLVLVILWSMALLASLDCLVTAALRGWRERKLDARVILSCVLLVTVLAWSASQGFRNDYEALFVVPMVVLAVVLALSTHAGGGRFASTIKALPVIVGVLGIVSVALVTAIYGAPLARTVHARGEIADQPHSIGLFGYAGLRRDMLAAARKCGITDPNDRQALALDDVTYFTFMQSRIPDHSTAAFPEITRQDPLAYLRAIKSQGIIASCRGLPPDLQARAQRQGQFCCLVPPNW